jgi:TolB protein
VKAAEVTPTPLWNPAISPVPDSPNERHRIVELDDMEAPYAMLHDLVDEAYFGLRNYISTKVDWDYLATLENAFVPLTSPLFPGILDDWLYTGRAISLNTAPVNANWVVVMREDFGTSIYWRVFVRTRFQDGSQGRPLVDFPWDFNARYSGNPRHYEQGGAYENRIPEGYWLDFTEIALSLGWERLPALASWKTAYNAARHNEFIFSDGLDWITAMQEIYPADALATPTKVVPPTHTPTATRWPTLTPTPTRTPWPSRTPTPTRTPTNTLIPPTPTP